MTYLALRIAALCSLMLSLPVHAEEARVELADGTVLLGTPVQLDGERLVLSSSRLGSLEVPLERVGSLQWQRVPPGSSGLPESAPADDAQLLALAGPGGALDSLALRDGTRLTGRVRAQ